MANEVKIEISLEEKQALDALTKLIKKTDEFESSFKEVAKSAKQSASVFIAELNRMDEAASKALRDNFNKYSDSFASNFKKSAKESASVFFEAFKKQDAIAEASFKKMDDGANKSSMAFSVFAGSVAANVATGALGLIKDSAQKMFEVFLIDGIQAAQEAESSLNKLSTALKISGLDVDKVGASLKNFASEMQSTTKFSDDLIVENMALLQSIGNLTEKGIKVGTSAAADLSAAMGIDLETAIRMVGKAANGEVASFKKYGIEIKQGATDSETFANALAVLNTKFGGSAAAQADTYAGRMEQLKNAFGDLQEETGNLIVKNKDITEGIGLLTKGIVDFTSYVVKNGPAVVSTFREMADIFLITPVKFWSDLLGGGDTRTELELTNDALSKTSDKIEKLQKFMQETPKGGMLDGTFTTRQEAINKLAALIDKEQKLLNDKASMTKEGGDAFVGPIQDKSAPAGGALKNVASDADVKYEEEKLALIATLKEEAAALEAEQKALKDEAIGLENETKLANLEEQAILEAEIQKNFDDMKAAQAVKSSDDLLSIEAKRRKSKFDADKKFSEDQEKARQADIQRETQYRNTMNGIANNFLNAGIALAKEGSVAMKALQTTQAVINTYTGATNALADTRPAFLAPVAAASIIALGLANVAKINGARFQTGGFVGGNSIAGDQNIIRANTGERVLTMAEQRNMIDTMASGSASNKSENINNVISAAFAQPIIVSVDGREIARATRSSLKEGYAI